ncbi:MAG: TldD/PmbA family protein [Theionarchaea archaeon]|nr:TldD/PmbA family protein [Theionarchaea archaeon]
MQEKTHHIVEKSLDLGASDVIAKGIQSKNQQLRFSNNELDIAKTWFDTVIHVFLVYDNRVVATEIRNLDSIDESVETLMKMARLSKPNPFYGGIAEGSFTYSPVMSDPKLKKLEDGSDFVMAAINKALEKTSSTAGILSITNEDISLSSSRGARVQDELTSIELSIRAFSQKEASGHSVSCSPTLSQFDPEKAGEEAGELARLAKDPVSGDEGTYDVVFSPLFLGSILSYTMEMTSAFMVLAGRSMYTEKLGKKVGSENITIAETPRGLRQSRCDDEGVPTRETTVIEKGILKTFLHNTSTATLFETDTTANAGLVIPQPRNIHMKPGDYTRNELIEEMDTGLLLTNTWYTRFQNIQAGDFSTIPRDAILKIEKGDIVGSLNNIRVSENLLSLYGNVEGVSKEQELIHWWIEANTPSLASHVLARDVHITRSTD